MNGLDLFDPSAFIAAEERRKAAPAPPQLWENPIIRSALPDHSGDATQMVEGACVMHVPSESQGPIDWREGLALLGKLPRPAHLGRYEWERLVSDAQSFGRMWAQQALDLGWTPQEMFGCPPQPWFRRMDPCGVVYLLDGRSIGEIQADRATIINKSGSAGTFYRGFDRSGAAMLWSAMQGGRND